jgi:hypothetical protein
MAKSKVIIDVSAAGADEAAKDLNNVAKATDNVAKSNTKVAESSKGMEDAFDAADEASGGLMTSLKKLATNPYALAIGALVSVIIGLKSALTSTAEGQKIWGDAMAKVGVIVDTVSKFISEKLVKSINEAGGLFTWLGNGIKSFIDLTLYPLIKGFNILNKALTGDFKGVGDEVMGVFDDIANAANVVVDTFNDIVAGVKAMGEEIAKTQAIQDEINAKQEAVRKGRNKSIVDEARINSLLSDQKAIIADTNKDINERASAIQKAMELTKQLLQTKGALNDKEIEIMNLEKQKGAFNQEQEATYAELLANRYRIMQEVKDKEIEFISQSVSLLNELKAKDAEVNQYQTEKMTERVADTTVKTNELVGIQTKAVEDVAAVTVVTEEQKRDAASQTMGNASTLMKEGSKQQKAFLIGQTLMETYKSATAAFSSFAGMGPWGVAAGVVAAAAAVASGLANVKRIAAIGGGGGGVPSSGGSGMSVPTIPKPVTEVPKAINDNNNQSIKAYIVEDDLTANVKKQQNQKEISSL